LSARRGRNRKYASTFQPANRPDNFSAKKIYSVLSDAIYFNAERLRFLVAHTKNLKSALMLKGFQLENDNWESINV